MQRVAACCSVLQCVVVSCRESLFTGDMTDSTDGAAVCCSVCCSVLQCVAVSCRESLFTGDMTDSTDDHGTRHRKEDALRSVLQGAAECCSVCCSVLQ